MELVSIVIPARNEENYIEKTLESIKSQTYLNIETIVVCNGCTDKTKEVAKEYAKILNLKENNVSKARNEGAKIAKGKFLIFLDADTVLYPEVIQTIYKKLKKNSYFGTIVGRSEYNKLSLIVYTKTKNIINLFYPWSNGIIFCRKSDFLKTNGFNYNITHGELRQFYKEIRKYSSYKRLNSTYVITSQRRLKKWGLKKVLNFWLYNNKNEYKPVR